MKYSELQKKLKKKTQQGPDFKPYAKVKIRRELVLGKGFIFAAVAIFFLVILVSATIFAFTGLKGEISRRVDKAVQATHGKRFEISNLKYSQFDLSLSRMRFEQIRANGVLRYNHSLLPSQKVIIDAPLAEISYQFNALSGVKLGINIQGLRIRGGDFLPDAKLTKKRLETLSEVSFQTWISLKGLPFNWKNQIKNWHKQFKKWVFDGALMEDIYMSGNVFFVVGEERTKVSFLTSKAQDVGAYLEGNLDDLRIVAGQMEPGYTESDVLIASKNLLKTPKLLEVRTLAEKKARVASELHPDISFDTFRHIHWSYLLARTFGSKFALRVTDAHEVGSKNASIESEKDRRNNAIGIEYAKNNLSDKELMNLITNDLRVRQNENLSGYELGL